MVSKNCFFISARLDSILLVIGLHAGLSSQLASLAKKYNNVIFFFHRLLKVSKQDGFFLLRDNFDNSRRILSFTSTECVLNVFIDQKEKFVEVGK